MVFTCANQTPEGWASAKIAPAYKYVLIDCEKTSRFGGYSEAHAVARVPRLARLGSNAGPTGGKKLPGYEGVKAGAALPACLTLKVRRLSLRSDNFPRQ